jgi:probable F420-dependent oxidoreductase
MGHAAIFPSQLGIWSSQVDVLPWTDASRLVRAVDEMGFGSLWFPESTGREAMANAGKIIATTTSLVVATGIANIFARDAIAMRNGQRTILDGNEGRFVLGLGVSHAPILKLRGATGGPPVQAMRDYLAAMDDAPFRGDYIPEGPIVLAALGPKMLELAAERTAGAHTYLTTIEHTRSARAILGDAELICAPWAIVGESRARALEIARGYLRRYLELPNYRRNLASLGWSEHQLSPDDPSEDLIDALVAIGSAEDVVGRVVEHLDAGASHAAVHILQERLDADDAIAVSERIFEAFSAHSRGASPDGDGADR